MVRSYVIKVVKICGYQLVRKRVDINWLEEAINHDG